MFLLIFIRKPKKKKYCGYSHVNTETLGRVIKVFGRAIAFISSLQKPGRMIEKLGRVFERLDHLF